MGCMGSGPARCKKCSRGYSLKGAKCLGKHLLNVKCAFFATSLFLYRLLKHFFGFITQI